MKAKKNLVRNALRLGVLILGLIVFSQEANAFRFNKGNTKKVINKTAFIIDEAYEISNYYDYWQGEMLSRAVYYNDYAYRLMQRRNYNKAIHYSLRAREYALRVIDDCDMYWDYYYYNNYGWSRSYGRNPYYNPNRYPNNHYHGNYNSYYNRYYQGNSNNYGNNNSPYYHSNNSGNNNSGRGSEVGGRSQFNPNNTSGGSLQTGHLTNQGGSGRNTGNFKNLNYDNYFDKNEKALLSQLPQDEELDREFKNENSSVRFNDKELKNKSEVISRNKENANTFSRTLNNNTKQEIKLIEPRKVEDKKIIDTRTNNTTTTKQESSPFKRVNPPKARLKEPVYDPSKTQRRNVNVEKKTPQEQRVEPKRTTRSSKDVQSSRETKKETNRTIKKEADNKKTNTETKRIQIKKETKTDNKNSSRQREIQR